ncbi:MAG: homoaconitate hydratase [Nanoarchaeota archaeon]|nr:homoaconitate hydratase [Nanoarchaeota archaeon]
MAISICDTTLRDGEQMPGVVFKPHQKIELAEKISDFGVNVIELMPSVSSSEEQVTRDIAKMNLKAEITASTMMRKKDIELAISCDVGSITLFTPVSDIHIHSIHVTREENLSKALEHIDFAKSHGLKIHFAGVDSTRADINYLIHFINSLSKYIDYFMVCDTVGCMTPVKTYILFKQLCDETTVPIALHAHNDFGMATANTLAGLEARANVFSGTFTGIGERAGNAPLEEVVTSLKFLYGIELEVNYSCLCEICNLVEKYSGVEMQAHKPLVGRNAFSHESGIHVNGVLKNPITFEPFDPRLIGQERRIILGKHSGKTNIKYTNPMLSDSEANNMLGKIKEISQEEKRSVSIEEILETGGETYG